ncbi:MAG: hypothetical protein AB8G15_16100 [Saprospiraceae bacterium]
MEVDEILDYKLKDTEINFFAPVRWWEKRRLLYNFIFVGVIVLTMITFSVGVERYGISTAVIHTLIVVLIANAFYSVGWGLEILVSYYFPATRFNSTLRMVFYLLGTLFSVSLAWFFYSLALSA